MKRSLFREGEELKFLADECCDTRLISSLREAGYDVLYVPEQMAGASDDAVLFKAYEEGRILLTEDKDFGELVYRFKKPSRGIILLRIDISERQLKWPRVKRLLKDYGDRLKGNFVVIESEKYRFRSLIFPL